MEILSVTETYINACELGDLEAYTELCDERFTAFYPNLSGCLVQGLNFQRYFFEIQTCSTTKSTIINPNITVFANGQAAIISYSRIYQTTSSDNSIIMMQFEETLVWEKKTDKWVARHLHRSQNSAVKQSVLPVV